MPTLSVLPPYPIFTDIDGSPIENGYIWIGQANLDPQTFPITAYWDAALTITATQPIRTIGGYPSNAGTPDMLYTNSDFSIRVMDKNGTVVYSAPSVSYRISSPVIPSISSADVSFLQAGTGAVTRTAQSKMREEVSVTDFGVVGDDSDETVKIQAAFDYIKTRGGKLVFPTPPQRYRITAPIGTNQTVVGDLANDVELYFEPGTEVFFAPSVNPVSRAAIALEGNNVAITGQLTLNSNKIVNWQSDPTPQRTPYFIGIVIGGKGYRYITKALGLEKSNAYVGGVICRNFNLPIVAYAASDVTIEKCVVEDFTDTGILPDDCLANVEVRYNIVRRGFDDCFFDRHYYNTPWVTAGRYIGNHKVHHNAFYQTFAKSCGFGGIADVDCHDNYFADTWYAAANIEIDANTWADNSKRVKYHDNIIVNAARNFDPLNTNLPIVQRAPVPDTTQQAGILFTTTDASWPAGRFEQIEVYNNLIINPGWNGVSGRTAQYVTVRNNKMQPGRTTKNSVDYDTGGQAVRMEGVVELTIKHNEIIENLSPALKFPYGYEIVGDSITTGVAVDSNFPEEVQNAPFVALSATLDDKVTYIGYSGLQTVGNQCTIFGYLAGRSLTSVPATSGYNNVLFGPRAGQYITDGFQNTGVGNQAVRDVTTGDDNTGVGHNALLGLTTGNKNTAVGSAALANAPAALSGCVAIGAEAGVSLGGTYDDSVMVGRASTVTGTNGIAIGYNTTAGANTIRMGNASITTANIQVGWTVTSDARAKEQVSDLDLGLEFAKSLRPVSYRRIGSTQEELGFIAQEVQSAAPRPLGLVQVDDQGVYGLRQNDLIAVLVKAVQELSARVEALEAAK